MMVDHGAGDSVSDAKLYQIVPQTPRLIGVRASLWRGVRRVSRREVAGLAAPGKGAEA